MRILGLHGWPGRSHDAAACLLENGHVVAFAEEERFSRQRHAFDRIPAFATAYCLSFVENGLDDIDVVAIGWDRRKHDALRGRGWSDADSRVVEALLPVNLFPRRRKPSLYAVDHHLAHAASAYRSSPFNSAAIVVIDGQGEDSATSLWHGKGDNIVHVNSVEIGHSLGYMYEAVTRHIGFSAMDVGKTMGLAAYGDAPTKFDQVELTSSGYQMSPQFHVALGGSTAPDERDDLLRLWSNELRQYAPENVGELRYDPMSGSARRLPNIGDAQRDLAARGQRTLEEAVDRVVQCAAVLTGESRICLAGGVALNCPATARVVLAAYCSELFAQPACGDSGTALGAALQVAAELGQPSQRPITDFALGPEFGDADMLRVLHLAGVTPQRPKNICFAVAELLARGLAVGWFQGRMEVGPRALGNRSILADASRADMRVRLNMIKGRELWRPLSPAVLEDDCRIYFAGSGRSPFMLQTMTVHAHARTIVPAVVHADGTARVQTVSETDNPRFYRLLHEVKARTGVGVLVNTSLNADGAPIACTPADALRTFYSTALDALALGNYLVLK